MDLDLARIFNDFRLTIEARYDKLLAERDADLRIAHDRVAELEAERDALKLRLSTVSRELVETQRVGVA